MATGKTTLLRAAKIHAFSKLVAADAIVVAIRDGKILAVGSEEEVQRAVGPSSRQEPHNSLSFESGVVVPGFIDNHIHLFHMGNQAMAPSLAGLNEREIIEVMRESSAEVPRGSLIRGGLWDFPAVSSPTKEMLDEAFPYNPVLLSQYGGHGLWANSLALRRMKIDRHTPDPPGGQIVHDASGEPTGLLRDMRDNPYLRKVMMAGYFSRPRIRRNLKKAFEMLPASGITSVQDNTWSYREVQVMVRDFYRKQKRLPVKVNAWYYGPLSSFVFHMRLTRFAPPYVERGLYKFFLDGTFTTRTAWLWDEYADEPGNYGKGKSKEEIMQILEPHVKRHHQCAFHAIGDRSISEFIDAVEEMQKRYPWTRDLRLRIEHAQLIRKEDIPRIRDLGICIASQPFAMHNGKKDTLLLGEERIRRAYPYRSLLDAGVNLSFGSDHPGEFEYKPLLGMDMAVNREGPEAITAEEALRCYTTGSAYAGFLEERRGRIEPGMEADLTVLAQDPLKAGSLQDVKVLATISHGNLTWRNTPSSVHV